MVDAADLKSAIRNGCAGSSPAVRTSFDIRDAFSFADRRSVFSMKAFNIDNANVVSGLFATGLYCERKSER